MMSQAARGSRLGVAALRLRRGWNLDLRSRIMLLILALLLGLGAIGIVVLRSAVRSGETLLRSRLEEALYAAVHTVGSNWVNHRSRLLSLADGTELAAALRDGRALDDRPLRLAGPVDGDRALTELIGGIIVRDTAGVARGTFRPEPGSPASTPPLVPVTLPLYDGAGVRVGSLDATLPLSALLPAGTWWTGIAGSVLGIFDADGAPLLPQPIGAALFAADRFEWDGAQWLTVRHELDEPRLTFAIAAPLDPFAEPFARAARQGTLALVIALAAGVALSTLLTRRMTMPLEKLAAAADDVSHGTLERRVNEDGPREIRSVARAFNIMTDSLQQVLRRLSQQEAVAAVGEFAAALAHEVRNPLTSVRLDLERVRARAPDSEHSAELLDRALAELERLDTTVSDALRVARSGRITMAPVDLHVPLDAAMYAARPAYDERCARLETLRGDTSGITVRGNPAALEQLFLNLLRNSAEATQDGGRTRVTVRTGDDMVAVEIADEGAGISERDAERIFEPFYSTKERGTGLGLPIARRIAQAHGGELLIRSTPGGGTTACVRIPLARSVRST